MKKLFLSLMLAGAVFSASQAAVQNFTLVDTKGVSHNLYSYLSAGKAVVIDFYFRSCGNCQAFAPKLDQIYKDYGSNAGNVIVISMEIDLATNPQIDAWKTQYQATYPSCGGQAARDYWGSNFYPTWGGGFAQVGVIIPNASNPSASNITYSATGSITTAKQQAIRDALNAGGFLTTGVADNTFDNASFSLYPNPAHENFTVEFYHDSNADATLEIFNVMGTKVIEPVAYNIVTGINSIHVNTGNLTTGTYMVVITSKENGRKMMNLQVAK